MSITETEPVETCFPEPKEIKVGSAIYVIRPLKVREFSSVSSSFVKIMQKVSEGNRDVSTLLDTLYDEMMELLDFVTERPEDSTPVGDLPIRYMPVFVNTFLEHNVVGDDVLKNWRSLIRNFGNILNQAFPGLFSNFQEALSGQ